MNDPLLGELTYDASLGSYISKPSPVPFLGGHPCRFVLEGYAGDPRPDEFRAAIQNVLDASPDVLTAAQSHVLEYCEEMLALYPPEHRPDVKLKKPGDVWSHVQFGHEFHVSRRADGDDEDGIYLSLECNCDWEVEHGLQLVLRDGRAISKVGSFDGHLTNADAYADPSLAGVIYRRGEADESDGVTGP